MLEKSSRQDALAQRAYHGEWTEVPHTEGKCVWKQPGSLSGFVAVREWIVCEDE